MDNEPAGNDWQDTARSLWKFLVSIDKKPIVAKRPEQTGIQTYMYVIQIEPTTANEEWFAFDEEAGIAELLRNQHKPEEYS